MKSGLTMNLALATGLLGMVISLLFVTDMIFSISNFRFIGHQDHTSGPAIEAQLRQAGLTIEYSTKTECKPRIQGKALTICSK